MLQEEAFFAATRIQIFHRGQSVEEFRLAWQDRTAAAHHPNSGIGSSCNCQRVGDNAFHLKSAVSQRVPARARVANVFLPVCFYRLSTTVRCAGPLSSTCALTF